MPRTPATTSPCLLSVTCLLLLRGCACVCVLRRPGMAAERGVGPSLSLPSSRGPVGSAERASGAAGTDPSFRLAPYKGPTTRNTAGCRVAWAPLRNNQRRAGAPSPRCPPPGPGARRDGVAAGKSDLGSTVASTFGRREKCHNWDGFRSARYWRPSDRTQQVPARNRTSVVDPESWPRAVSRRVLERVTSQRSRSTMYCIGLSADLPQAIQHARKAAEPDAEQTRGRFAGRRAEGADATWLCGALPVACRLFGEGGGLRGSGGWTAERW